MRVPVALVLALLVLAVPPARCADAPASATVDYAKIYLKGDRVLEGVIVKEDEKTITLKTKFATVPVLKDQVVRVVRSETTKAGLAARKEAEHVYLSLLLGYRLVKPKAWSFKLDPPEPLTDVLIRRYDDDMEIAISGQPDPNPEAEMTDRTLQMMTRSVEAKLREKFLNVKREVSKQTTFKGLPALHLEFTLQRKRSLRPYRLTDTVFRKGGKILFLHVWAPAPKFEEARKAYDEVVASFAFAESKRVEGNRLFEPTNLFSVEKPEAWTFITLPAEGQAVTTAVMGAPDKSASVRIDASRTDAKETAEAWAKASEAERLKALAGGRTVSAGPVNVSNRFGYRLLMEGAAGGKPLRRAVYFLKDEARGFVITADVAADKAAALQPVVDDVLDGFRVLNDLLTEGVLERGLKAIDLCDTGDKKLDAKQTQAAKDLYDQAIAEYPRFANAFNNKGVACLDADDVAGARQALQQAQRLFGEDLTIRLNLANCRLREAMQKIEAGKPADAIRLVDEATSLAGSHADARPPIAALYANIGAYYAEKDNFEQASTLFKRALRITPDDAQLKRSLSILLSNAAVTYYNKGQEAKAMRLAKESLKYDPSNGHAKELIDAILRR